jgi:hypothetical protein
MPKPHPLGKDVPDECDKADCHKPPKQRYYAGGDGPDGFLCNEHDAEIMGERPDNNYGKD